MESMIRNYINGNLTEAKAQAKRKSLCSILDFLLSIGKQPREAGIIAGYLKGQIPFQMHCDMLADIKTP